MPTTKKKAASRKATPNRNSSHSKSGSAKPKTRPLPPTALQLAVADLRRMGPPMDIEDWFESLIAYAITSEDFHRENEFVPRFNYITVAKYARRILIAALREIPDPVLDPDLI